MKARQTDTLTTFRGKNKQDISQNDLSLNWVKCHEIQLLLREAKIFSAKTKTNHTTHANPHVFCMCFQWKVFSYYHYVHITCSKVYEIYEIKLRAVH